MATWPQRRHRNVVVEKQNQYAVGDLEHLEQGMCLELKLATTWQTTRRSL